MSHPTRNKSKKFDEYECINGPRPPVPGEESQISKMTTEGASNSTSSSNSNSNRSPDSENSYIIRIKKWQESFTSLLADNEGVQLLLKFVEEEAGIESINYTRLKFYFAVEGLKLQREEKIIRKLIRRISDEIIRDQIAISIELRNTITAIVQKKIPPNTDVFNDLQNQVKETIATTSYLSFLTSEFFCKYNRDQDNKFETKPVFTATNVASAINNAGIASSSADGVASSSGKTFELLPTFTTSNLQTLHEDTELNLSEEPILTKTTTDRPMPRLTEGLLLATQTPRLHVRPPGSHGLFDVPHNTSFNPVSRQDSERQSASSASLNNSEVNSKDGKPYIHRRPTTAEDVRACLNPQAAAHRTAIKPLAQGPRASFEPTGYSRLEQASRQLDPNTLIRKLNELQSFIKKEEEKKMKKHNIDKVIEKLSSTVKSTKPLPVQNEDDDQSILDLHVQRVFSPNLSPGTISPINLAQRYHHRSSEMSTSMPDFVLQQSMRHSKSIPEHASTSLLSGSKNKSNHKKSPTYVVDSGISACSGMLPYKLNTSFPSIEYLSDETMRKLSKDDSRKSRKPMPLPSSHQQSLMPTSSSHNNNNTLPRISEDDKNYTFAVYTFGDEKIPYRTKIEGTKLTLKHFKDNLPKKGNFRFYFTTTCDDPDSPVIQEEVKNDTDILPLYEGKIMGTVKSEN